MIMPIDDTKDSTCLKHTEILLKVLNENSKNLDRFEALKKSYEFLDISLKRKSKSVDPDIYRILNFIQFASLCSNDLNIAAYEVSNPKLYSLEWEIVKLFHTKILALVLFEIFEDFIRLIPNPMYKVVSKFDIKNEYGTQLKALHAELSEMRKEDYEYLKNIRNKISAHKEDDASVQIKIIKGIDTVRVTTTEFKLRTWLNRVLKILHPILLNFHNKIIQDSGLKARKLIKQTGK